MLLPLLRHYAVAQTKYRIHSPFVGHWIEEVLEDSRAYYAFDELEGLWERLKLDERKLAVTDLGAGSRADGARAAERSVASIARTAVCRPSKGRFLFRQTLFSKPTTILELGTSLGISALYFRAAAPKARLVTVEGCPNIAAVARENFRRMGGHPPESYVGNFDDVLPGLLPQLGQLDLLYLDGNHREAPTLRYFELCLPYVGENSVFLLDDIHWSAEMQRAWQQLSAHPSVSLSIDTFHTGLLFFKKEISGKKHFVLTPWYCKPWQSGFLTARSGVKE